jgi:hypothetical protein
MKNLIIAKENKVQTKNNIDLNTFIQKWQNFILDRTLREIWMRLICGKLEANVFRTPPYPLVFCLSTGRVGTQTLSSLFRLANNVVAYHEPRPILYGLSKMAYSYMNEDDKIIEILGQAFLTAREDILREALRCNKGYIETSPQVTFLAPIIAKFFPQAKFIHIVRDPRHVVRSGMRRQWYVDNPNDKFRITPSIEDENYSKWNHYSPFQKNVWLWSETNRWIREFTSSLPPENKLLFFSEDIFSGNMDKIYGLFNFLNTTSPSEEKIIKILKKKLNIQKYGKFPTIDDWTPEMLKQLVDIAGNTSSELGYDI